MNTHFHDTVSILGLTKVDAMRAVRWLNHRGILGFYRKADRSLNVFVTKHGREWTQKAAEDALAAGHK